MKNKCTLLIDGNWLLISRFSVMRDLFSTSKSDIELDYATENLKDMMARSINIMINKIPEIDNIIFISDGGSWRKLLPIPEQLNDITYKGNRDDGKTQDISWSHVFKALNELSKSCESRGITTSNHLNIEGDDWIWYWSRRLNADKINCIIWSSDHDLLQLVQNKNSIFTGWYYERSGKSELNFHESLQEETYDPTDLDFFMKPIQYKPILLENLSKQVNKTIYINPDSIILSKVICGDSGDNIKSVARIVKSGRKYGVGEKDWNKISEELNIYTIQDLIANKQEIAEKISKIKKFQNKIKSQDILEMIEYNIKLVWLNEEVIPEPIICEMNNQEYKTIDIDYFRNSYKTLLEEDNSIKDLFES